MPLHWSVSHPARLVMIVAKGEVKAFEVLDLLAGLDREQARPYRKIADIGALESDFDDGQIQAFARRVRERENSGPVGPIAIVAASAGPRRMAQLFLDAAEQDRPMQLFEELHLARRWLDTLEMLRRIS